MVVGFQETRFRTQWHCYYTRQVRRIPVSIPRSSSGYSYQYLYLYDIKPAEVVSGTSCLSDSVYPCRISHICIRSPSLYHSKFRISKSITKKPSKKSAKKKKKNPYLPTMSIKAIHFPSPGPPTNLTLTLTTIPKSPPPPPHDLLVHIRVYESVEFSLGIDVFFKAAFWIMKMESQGGNFEMGG